MNSQSTVSNSNLQKVRQLLLRLDRLIAGKKRRANQAISGFLILCILTLSAPAAPAILGGSLLQIQQDVTLAYKLNDWFAWLRPSVALPAQETQAARDATVARIGIILESSKFTVGKEIALNAVAYDGRDVPVSGVKFDWTVENSDGVPQVVDETLLAGEVGQLTITATGANARETVRIEVVDPADAFPDDQAPREVSRQMARQFNEWDVENMPEARSLRNTRGNSPGKPKGKNNFNVTAPVLSIPGRGLNLDLSLNYNSLVWSKLGQDVSYDMDRDWVAPGWTVGFGKIVNMIAGGITQFDADGTRRFYSGEVASLTNRTVYIGQSTDGTFIKAKTETTYNGCYRNPTTYLKYPDGTTVRYSLLGDVNACFAAGDPITMVPNRIQDRNGNQINITYHSSYNSAPGRWINTITDTLGRVYTFDYALDNNRYLLTGISGPGLPDASGQSVPRTFVRLNYRDHAITHNFSGLTPHVRENTVKVLSAIYYPSTQTGYWFGDASADSPSYSSYGMIRKVQERSEMSYTAATGVINSGSRVSRERVYSYPITNARAIDDVPAFSTVTESWEGMTTGAPTTTYEVNWDADPRTTTIISTDNSRVTEYSYNMSSLPDSNPEKAKDGITYKTEYYGTGPQMKAMDEVEWEPGYQVSPDPGAKILRPKKTTHSEYENGITLTKTTTNTFGSEYNQVIETQETGYGGPADFLRRSTSEFAKFNDIATDPAGFIDGDAWRALPRLINLPVKAEVFENNSATARIGYTKYDYDINPLQAFSGANPPGFCIDMYCAGITARGNLSKTTVYDDAATLDAVGAHSDSSVYDKAGNLVEYTPEISGTAKNTYKFTFDTKYGYPEEAVIGASSAGLSLKSTAVYNFNTGLPQSVIDPNLQPVQFERNADNWRLTKTTMPTGGYSVYGYNDASRTYSQSVYTAAGVLAGKQQQQANGLGQPYRQQSYVKTQTVNGQAQEVWNVVETTYDEFGRVKKTSNPFTSASDATHATDWTESFYDDYGRVWKTVKPDQSTKYIYYNEAGRPAGASGSLGNTVRLKDPTGREKWSRTDADGNLAEIIEPDPTGTGAVATGGLLTKYNYDRLGRLLKTEQGVQQRNFRYDSLGRLTHQKMAEAKATLNNTGDFVGEATGLWSDAYTYDKFSNVVTYTDARGVKITSSYTNPSTQTIDPLNRLFSVSYSTNGAADVLPSPTVNYAYQTTDNVSQLKTVTVAGVSTTQLDYDAQGRAKEKKTTLASRPNNPMTVNYAYDSLNRVTDVIYPVQYAAGSTTGAQKNLHYDFDTAGRTTNLKVDNVDYASNFVFNAFDQITSVKIGPNNANQITESYGYSPLTGQLENQKVMRGGTALLDLSYVYQQCSCSTGGSGQIKSIVDNLDRNQDRKYDYDAVGRLKKVTGGINGGWSQNYSYDRYGNRRTVQALGVENLRPEAGSSSSDQKTEEKSDQALSGTTSASVPTAKQLLSNVKRLTVFDQIGGDKQNVAAPEQSSTGAAGNRSSAPSDNHDKEPAESTGGTGESFNPPFRRPFDYNGDGISDYSVYQRGGGTWKIKKSGTGQIDNTQFGSAGDQIAPADYDGDGKTDIAVWQPATGAWYVLKSSDNTYYGLQWGQTGDAIAPADYDGDGKADIAVWRPTDGGWYILRSSDGSYTSTAFGHKRFGDIPVPGDYDGDGKADIAVWRPTDGNWYILQSSNGQFIAPHLGTNGFVPVPADYDGDGKIDLAVWSLGDSYWYVQPSSGNPLYAVLFGEPSLGDVPVPADYDGDGKADMAVWRASDNGTWHVKQSSNGAVTAYQLGASGNVPTPAAYIRRSSAPKNQIKNVPRDGLASLTYDETSNRITTAGFTYDYAGNQTRKVGEDGIALRFQYDAAGRLVKVKNDGQQTITTYTYGASRERLITQEGDENSTLKTYYAWEAGSVISEYVDSPSSTLVWTKNYIFMSGALLATQEQTGNGERVQFNHPDQLGTRVVTNPSNGTSFEQKTLPFGTALDSESTGSINRRFTSYDRSAATSLDYATNRFYDSSQGRFTQVDPITMDAARLSNPQTLNLYAYVANDPINKNDPSGLDPDPRISLNTIGIYGGYGGGTNGGGYSLPSGVQAFLQGFFGNMLSRGHDYAGLVVRGLPLGPAVFVSMADRYGLPNSGEKQTVTSKKSSQTKCNGDIASLFSDSGAYFFDNSVSSDDKIMPNRPIMISGGHNHLYGSQTDSSVSANLYVPVGGKIVSPATRVPGSKYLGSSRSVYEYPAGVNNITHNANYVLIQFAKLGNLRNVTVAIFHVDSFNLEKQPDGRTKFGTIGFSGAEDYGSGGQIGKKGGHSHFELYQGLRTTLGGKELSFDSVCK